MENIYDDELMPENFEEIAKAYSQSLKKKGFVSTALVYSFIIVFMIIMLSLLQLYTYRDKIANKQVMEVKNILNEKVEHE